MCKLERSWHGPLIGSALLTLALSGWAAPPAAVTRPLIDINSATSSQLKTLPGVTDIEAAKIVAGRPYLSKADLVGTKAIPAGRYLAIKRLIVARQTGKPNGKR